MEQNEGEIRLYVACLASYNNGILHGVWIDATQSVEAIHDQIAAMLNASQIEDAEEYAIHDYEGFESVSIAEYQGIESVIEIAAFIEEHGALGGKLIAYFGDLEEAREAISDRYAGQYPSLEDFARELTEETTCVPQNLAFYIDYERMARDLEIGDVLSIETGSEQVHVFWSH
ncbi:Antirestriction protein [Candidatus Phaeomarinobacter ectocarpi]|uniref:Antirestriction protein n=1 Tax=Candidatus Phaeomarinibacter ectocarpi TaxID=1458461 RepID=X5MM33_9HYPH|nr:antirestriction protein ArdA [Candidatus Phaeomarinobacter ectocarpi]CDO60025.1 Antirestriction protein [Candidatus Phaeomarinobacter ectocarpi]